MRATRAPRRDGLDAEQQQWRAKAACVGTEPRLFDAVGKADLDRRGLARSQAVCDGCPVTAECEAWARADWWTGYSAGQAWYGGEPVPESSLPQNNCETANSRVLLESRHNPPLNRKAIEMKSPASHGSRKRGARSNRAQIFSPAVTRPALDDAASPVVDLTLGRCACGCGEQVARRFRQGHDARLRGVLLTAHRTDAAVQVVQGGERRVLSALQVARLLDHDTHSWSARLAGAK